MMFEVEKHYGRANIGRTIRFTEHLLKQLNEVATEQDVSVNSLVLQCCQYALDNMKPKDHE